MKKKGILRKREPTKESPEDEESDDEDDDEDDEEAIRRVRGCWKRACAAVMPATLAVGACMCGVHYRNVRMSSHPPPMLCLRRT